MNVFSKVITQCSRSLSLRSAGLATITIAAIAAPALADSNASVRGSVTYVTPGGYSTSISAEKTAPTGYNFDGNVTVTITPGTNDGAPLGMTLGSSSLTGITATTTPLTARLKDAVITKLGGITGNDQASIDAYSAILKAAAGANGLE